MSAKKDWVSPRTAHQHVAYLQDGQSPTGLVIRMVTHGPVPTTAADKAEIKSKRIVGTILAFSKLGFVSAPYSKKAKGSKDQQAKPQPLLVAQGTSRTGEVTSVKVYGFHKVNSTFDKGPRDEDFVSTLHLGQTLTFFLNDFMYDSKEKAVFSEGFPGVIPAYSVVEVQLNPSHNQSAGYGLKIAKITPHGPTLYSYMSSAGFQALTRTAEEASASAKAWAQECVSAANQVEQARYAFVGTVDKSAAVVNIRDDLPYFRIECPEESGTTPLPGLFSLDLPVAVMQRFTNFPDDVVGARTFVDIAIAAGALKVLVTYDDYYNYKESSLGQYRCVPLIDTEAFLAPVQENALETSKANVLFTVPWLLSHDPLLQVMAMRVSTVALTQEEGEEPHDDVFEIKTCVMPPCPDMALVSPVCAFDRGYRVLVGNPGYNGEDPYYVLDCYFNAAPKHVTRPAGCGGGSGRTTGYKRVRFDGADEA